jgi:hypothetical protein
MVAWGNVPAFIAAVLTGLSLIIAAMTYRRTQRNSEREQASLVAGWIEPATDPARPDSAVGFIVRIRNASKLPVYDIYIEKPKDSLVNLHHRVLRPQETLPSDTKVEPNTSFIAGLQGERHAILKGRPSALPEFTFHDAAGRWWRRDEFGRLRQQTRITPWWSRWPRRFSNRRGTGDSNPDMCECEHLLSDHHEAEDVYADRYCHISGCKCEDFKGSGRDTGPRVVQKAGS